MVATRPPSANYIRKMSDYCDRCWYEPGAKSGNRSCPFNSLYWDFLIRHRRKLEKNPRVAMMYRTLDRMKEDNRRQLLKQARKYKANLNAL